MPQLILLIGGRISLFSVAYQEEGVRDRLDLSSAIVQDKTLLSWFHLPLRPSLLIFVTLSNLKSLASTTFIED